MWGNPLNTTPFFNELCENGVFFNHCFTPTWGTARGVWCTITGIPDVETPRTASRNMAMVSQHSIMNDFDGYEKFYFIGGSTSWANIRGLLKNNIDSLHLYEGDDYKSPKVDVWGISDKNLFLEANDVLKQQQQAFYCSDPDGRQPPALYDTGRRPRSVSKSILSTGYIEQVWI